NWTSSTPAGWPSWRPPSSASVSSGAKSCSSRPPPTRSVSSRWWGSPASSPSADWRLRPQVLVLHDELAGDEGRALGVLEHGRPRPGRVEGAGHNFSAQLRRLGCGRVGVVDGEGDAPVGRGGRVVGGDGVEGGDHVDEAL